MRCEHCRHWGHRNEAGEYVAPEWDYEAAAMRRCLAIRQSWDVKDEAFDEAKGLKERSDYGDWDEVERIEAEALKAAKAVAQDGSSYAASIRTAADFGCVLFEAQS